MDLQKICSYSENPGIASIKIAIAFGTLLFKSSYPIEWYLWLSDPYYTGFS